MKIEPIEYTTIPQPGDVALIYGSQWPSTMLVAAQRAIGLRDKFSHMLLNVTGVAPIGEIAKVQLDVRLSLRLS
jgi:hypothetical protein